MDKRDNYFETRIRAAQAQINQCSGFFSLSQDLVFRAGAQLMVGCVQGALVPNTRPPGGRCSTPIHSWGGAENHLGFPGTPETHSKGCL